MTQVQAFKIILLLETNQNIMLWGLGAVIWLILILLITKH